MCEAVLDQAAVRRERQDSVQVVVAGDRLVQDIAVGLMDVNGVLTNELDREVLDVEPVGAVCLDAVVVVDPVAVFLEAATDDDVLSGLPRTLKLKRAQRVVALL